jgi:hypothetical protein
MTPSRVGALMPFTWQEESISPLQRPRSAPLRSPLSRKALGGHGNRSLKQGNSR